MRVACFKGLTGEYKIGLHVSEPEIRRLAGESKCGLFISGSDSCRVGW